MTTQYTITHYANHQKVNAFTCTPEPRFLSTQTRQLAVYGKTVSRVSRSRDLRDTVVVEAVDSSDGTPHIYLVQVQHTPSAPAPFRACERCGDYTTDDAHLCDRCQPETVIVPASDTPAGVHYPRQLVDDLDAILDEYDPTPPDTWGNRGGGTYRALAIAGLALALLTGSASAQLTHEQARDIQAQMTVPEGCVITRTFEDWTALGVCAGGYMIVLNAQGLPGDKPADIPYAVSNYTLTDEAGNEYTYAVYD